VDRCETEVAASPALVWSTLSDGYALEHWVVGCKTIRRIDGEWPRPGATAHHRVGVGPLSLQDSTSVVEAVERELLVLRARARPAGVAHVRITIAPGEDGSSCVAIEEGIVSGPTARLPQRLLDLMIHGRNVETLRRLRNLVESRRT
jgi:uncharacterized protein YndB with AHSA1/START domain